MSTNQSLMDSFQQAVNLVRAQDFVKPYFQTVQSLSTNFAISFALAVAEQDAETQKALVKGLTDFISETASTVPSMAQAAGKYGEAVELLCNTLDVIVKDKSLIPENFKIALLKAAQKKNLLNGGSGYLQANSEAVRKIMTSAHRF